MSRITLIAVASLTLALAACGKKHADSAGADAAAKSAEPPAAAAAAPPASTAPSAAPAASSADAEELARKQAQLDYATMEDGFINDPKAQWASAVTTSSTFGDAGKKNPSAGASSIVGKVDGETWTNDNQSIGFDWLQAEFAKPVSATEVRVVFPNSGGAEAVSKIELIDVGGTAHTMWSGINTDPAEQRGQRTWLLRKTEATPYKVKAVKVTIANNLKSGYKVVDAIQLVGE